MKAANSAAPDSLELQEGSAGQFVARGPLTFATARRSRELGLSAFGAARSREILVECAGISASDSAGMTVLLDWLSYAKQSGRALHFGNLPAQVQAIARISDVLELLERGVS
ncbi:MAG TPA: STAS domain-containing protein [Steroidobacteraceae bacterium]|nr:STAS domain-containing protein [Steroidobacteraceae bacterium]